MEHNKLKIISNQSNRRLSYYFKNESCEWVRVPNSSVLSRKEYTETSIREKIYDIVKVIDDIYNPGNRGVDVIFEGQDEEYSLINDTINIAGLSNDIFCRQKKTKVAVVGKIGSGKTTLIESLGAYVGSKFNKQKKAEYDVYLDQKGNTEWFELTGIDLGKEYIIQSQNTLDKLAESGLTVLVYCFSTCKIEKLEENLILSLNAKYPELKVLVVLTSCIDDDSELLAEQISKQLKQSKVIPILAQELKTRCGTIPSFGLDQVVQYIYEGK